MTKILKAGVIGAGVFGGYHAAQWAKADDARLVGVFDPHEDRARAAAERHGGAAFGDLAALLAQVDVVSVCSPASAHGDGALAALRAGVSVYVEKPIAADLKTADAIVDEARRRGRVAACGFLERVTARALGLFDFPQAPLVLEARRLSLPSARNLDVSVVLDLMIHDLDLALALARCEALTVEAEGVFDDRGLLCQVDAEVTFENGFTARCAASRTARARERGWRLLWPGREVVADLLAAPDTDPLAASLAAFAAAVRGERPAPLATALDGARALDLALAVERAVGG